jgi:hypothetical protein
MPISSGVHNFSRYCRGSERVHAFRRSIWEIEFDNSADDYQLTTRNLEVAVGKPIALIEGV